MISYLFDTLKIPFEIDQTVYYKNAIFWYNSPDERVIDLELYKILYQRQFPFDPSDEELVECVMQDDKISLDWFVKNKYLDLLKMKMKDVKKILDRIEDEDDD